MGRLIPLSGDSHKFFPDRVAEFKSAYHALVQQYFPSDGQSSLEHWDFAADVGNLTERFLKQNTGNIPLLETIAGVYTVLSSDSVRGVISDFDRKRFEHSAVSLSQRILRDTVGESSVAYKCLAQVRNYQRVA